MAKKKQHKRPKSLIDQACDAVGVTRSVYNGAMIQLREGTTPLEGLRLQVLEKYLELKKDAKERTEALKTLG